MPMGLAQCCCDRCLIPGCAGGNKTLSVLVAGLAASGFGCDWSPYNGLYLAPFTPGSSAPEDQPAGARICAWQLPTGVLSPVGCFSQGAETFMCVKMIYYFHDPAVGPSGDPALYAAMTISTAAAIPWAGNCGNDLLLDFGTETVVIGGPIPYQKIPICPTAEAPGILDRIDHGSGFPGVATVWFS